VGVIGTPGTIRSGAYQGALARLAPDARVSAMACPLFVPLAEEGWIGGDVPIQVARRYLASLAGVDTLVLGCTHYPVLREVIGAAMGPEVRLVDSTEATAEAAAAWLGRERIENEGSESGGERLFVTDLSDGFGAVAERFFGRPVQTPELVDIAF
jgi:glutamate racemase